MKYASMSAAQLAAEKEALTVKYQDLKEKNLTLNMARGKPSKAQLELSTPLLTILDDPDACFVDGIEARNYGELSGLPSAKKLFAEILGCSPEEVFVGGNASLQLMHMTISEAYVHGLLHSERPWKDEPVKKWICPVPGYDRHFAITESFGFENIPVPMNEDGPDMDVVERIAMSDACVKGIWCVPKYSNPGGVTYSDEVVRRLGFLRCAAHDFRIFWDNAYSVHHLYDEPERQDQLLDIAEVCKASGNPNRYVKFASTSKVTIAGAGIAAMASSPDNTSEIKQRMGIAPIGGDKINQLRHARFLPDADALREHMSKHAAILRPKFELVEQKLSAGLEGVGGCSWSHPRGGYFVMFNAPEGTAKRIVQLAKQTGVVLTGAGATWPGGVDPHDSDIRIAPSLPPIEELDIALDVFCGCVKLAYAEKLLIDRLTH